MPVLFALGNRHIVEEEPVHVEKGRLAAAFGDYHIAGKTGAGEGIRTLDPNLGKVVLYP